MLKIWNSLTGKKEVLTPIEPGKVRLYVCGMTVYDLCHLGHARVMVIFDMVARYLRSRGLDVCYVRNITDIDDKIIQRAAENGEDISALTERFVAEMHRDANALGVAPPDLEPRATEHIAEIVAMIKRLIDKRYAYVAADGDVFYSVRAFPDYGQLSGKNIEELRAGARVGIREAKDDPLDFVLWKVAKPGEPSWDSPWGRGRPGWHIECSAMSTHLLGAHFDIHGGGQDLQFPHHENEIAQSEGATGQPFVNIWMHNGFVRVDEEKMSKSLGNFFTVREILKRYRPEEVRYFILASHYRSPLNYSSDNLDAAKAALRGLYTSLRGIEIDDMADAGWLQAFHEAMDDDFNTPKAMALLHDLAHDINRTEARDIDKRRRLAGTLRSLAGVLGLLVDPVDAFLQQGVASGAEPVLSDGEIQSLIVQRKRARDNKNYAESDRIREALMHQGVALEDTEQGTFWQRI